MRQVIWTPAARSDLLEIDIYWTSIAEELADRTLDWLSAAGDYLTGMPHAGASLDETDVRKWTVRGTRYLLIYRIVDDAIEVLRVYHQSENWRDELS